VFAGRLPARRSLEALQPSTPRRHPAALQQLRARWQAHRRPLPRRIAPRNGAASKGRRTSVIHALRFQQTLAEYSVLSTQCLVLSTQYAARALHSALPALHSALRRPASRVPRRSALVLVLLFLSIATAQEKPQAASPLPWQPPPRVTEPLLRPPSGPAEIFERFGVGTSPL